MKDYINKPFSDEEINFLRNNDGVLSNQDIANKLGRTISSVKTKLYTLRKNKPGSTHKWEASELRILKDKYKISTLEEMCALLPKRKEYTIRQKALSLGLKRDMNLWTLEENEIMKLNYAKLGPTAIQELLPNRTLKTITTRARMLGILYNDPSHWSELELQLLKDNYSTYGPRIVELFPNRQYLHIKKKAQSEKICRQNHEWEDWQEQTLVENYGKMRTDTIADMINLPYSLVRAKASRMHLRAENRSLCLRRIVANYNFFSEINLETCYWSGYLAADGNCNNKSQGSDHLRFHLNSGDICILEAFRDTVQSDATIQTYPILNKSGTTSEASRMGFCSQEMVDDLERNFNITPNKTLTLEPPNLEGEDNNLAFCQGLCDGDGWSYYQWNNDTKKYDYLLGVCGTKAICEYFKFWMDRVRGEDKNTVRDSNGRGKTFVVHYSGKAAHLIRERFAKLDLPFVLPRKWDIEEPILPPEEFRHIEIIEPNIEEICSENCFN